MSPKSALLILFIVVLGGLAFVYFKGSPPQQSVDQSDSVTKDDDSDTDQLNNDDAEGMEEDLGIVVTSHLENQKVTSPVTLTGDAKGWYFEGSFPVKIVDANYAVLGEGYVTAQGDWMTDGFVPFEGVVTFSNPTTAYGYIIFMADNPSGLPENAKEYQVKVTF